MKGITRVLRNCWDIINGRCITFTEINHINIKQSEVLLITLPQGTKEKQVHDLMKAWCSIGFRRLFVDVVGGDYSVVSEDVADIAGRKVPKIHIV